MSAALTLWLAAAMMAFLAGSAALRAHAGGAGVAALLVALALYTIGNLMMVRVMRFGGMAIAISLSAILQLIMAKLLAIFGFGERPGGTQLAGIALGVVAVALIVLPAGAGE